MRHPANANAPAVLVVEDEPLLRMMATALVEEAGLVPVEARNAGEAMAILERRDDVSVVFSDIQMPGGMDGLALAQAVRKRWPPVKVILTSGRRFPDKASLAGAEVFLAKPYNPTRLVDELQRLAS